MKRLMKVSAAIGGALVMLFIGIAIGSSNKTTAAERIVTRTVTTPGPTVTKTVPAKPATPRPAGRSMPGDGTFTVGTAPGDWAPGTWHTAGANTGGAGNCYWATLSNLTGNISAIISNNNVTGPTVLTVGAGVAGIQVSGCDTWHLEK